MRRYETVAIVDPDVLENERILLFDRIKEIILQKNGSLIEFDDWGIKRLAYEIRKKIRGYYIRLDYCGTGLVVDELERFFRINDNVLKFMTIMLSENADVEKIREEIAAAKTAPVKTLADDLSSESELLFDENVSLNFEDAEEE